MNEEMAEAQTKLIVFLGTEHPHLSFEDIFALSETIIKLVKESENGK